MQNWTDPIIHWNQLPGTEVKRLVDTWGMTPEQIARYDKKHGYKNSAPKATPEVPSMVGKIPPLTTKAPAKVGTRQKHTGADGEVKFVEHRNLFVGFYGGRVVVTKRTREACQEALKVKFGVKLQGE